jgi:hypothetical protein
MARPRRPALDAAPFLLLGLAVIVASVLLLGYESNQTFYQDTWAFLMHRQGFNADAFLEPHNEHIVVLDVAIQKVLLQIFGLSSAMPEFVFMTALLAFTAVLLFVYARRRAGAWPAALMAILLLFVGPAWQVLLWPFEMVFVGSIAAGIGMLLALEREDRRGDRLACLLLVVCFGFSTLGISFGLAAIVDFLLGWRRRGARRAYVWALPFFLFAVWYAGWGHTAEKHLTLHNVLRSPLYLLEGAASSLSSLLGVSNVSVTGQGSPGWGWAVLAAIVALVAYGVVRRHRFSTSVLPPLVAGASFWLLAGANYIAGREAISSRYAYAGAAFSLLVAADLLKGVRWDAWRPSRVALGLAAAVTLAAVLVNLSPLREGHQVYREQAVLTRADLAAMDIAEPTIAPGFELAPEVAGTPSLIDVFADEYFPVKHDHGTPAYSTAALARAPKAGRRQADIVLAFAGGLTTSESPGAALGSTRGCTRVAPGGGPVDLGPGTTRIGLAAGPHAAFSLRRFASGEFPVPTAGAEGGSVTAVKIPADLSARPWQLQVEASQTAFVCPPKS